MQIPGRRECQSCGTRWSYFDTGSTACPECGSMHSVGVGDRTLHTDGDAELDLSTAMAWAAEGSVREAAARAAEEALGYIKRRGFIDEGELLLLDDAYVTAHELRHAASELGRRLSLTDEEEYYLLELLDVAEQGNRPSPETVPASMRHARGLGAAAAVRAYREDLRTWMDHETTVEEGRTLLGPMDDQIRRIRALDGDVTPADADRLVAAARGLGEYLRTGEESVLEEARAALDARSRF